MSMFCYQCQETAHNTGCTAAKGVCGKPADVANLQDLLIHACKGVSVWAKTAAKLKIDISDVGPALMDALFTTVTNANFDADMITDRIDTIVTLRNKLKAQCQQVDPDAAAGLPPLAIQAIPPDEYQHLAPTVGVLSCDNEDVRSLQQLLIYGLKGIAAYAHHAGVLGKFNRNIDAFLIDALASTTVDHTVDEMVARVLKAGEMAVTTMSLLDNANTDAFGNPEITEVNLGVGNRPGILVSGHDLKDLQELLEQTKDTEIDIYTHSEMLPAHYYPAFKKYPHLKGNYGSAWYHQKGDFDSFNGPILMTTNCIVPPKESYRERLYTTGTAGFPGSPHIADRTDGHPKDFSAIIARAKDCPPPTELESGTLVGGFAHAQVMALADKVVAAVKSGAIKKFVVMAGCDGRQKGREYFTDVAKQLPEDTVILTAGCAKYRYNKLQLGDIGGIPRVLDAGQCNDSYSLAVIALKLKEVFGVADINELPIAFDIAWYEQKAVAVLLALLHLGVKGLRLGPTLPAFLSPNVAKVLVENFDITPTGTPSDDVASMTA